MKLIADSGSTKTDWVLSGDNGVAAQFHTQGINPFHQSEEDILSILRQELVPQCGGQQVSSVMFYGSGVRPELEPVMVRLLQHVFTQARVEAHGDLLGAARAVCGHAAGIACILGTGANSGLYDGCRIVGNTPPLGYILGDEGSGAVLGRRFLNRLYKGFLGDALVLDFEKFTGMSMADVIGRVYRQPMANRFLASLSPFIGSHMDHAPVRQIVIDNFRDFFRSNIVQYQRPDLEVGFVGSIAFFYEEQLREAAAAEGFRVGRILKSPIRSLADF